MIKWMNEQMDKWTNKQWNQTQMKEQTNKQTNKELKTEIKQEWGKIMTKQNDKIWDCCTKEVLIYLCLCNKQSG